MTEAAYRDQVVVMLAEVQVKWWAGKLGLCKARMKALPRLIEASQHEHNYGDYLQELFN